MSRTTSDKYTYTNVMFSDIVCTLLLKMFLPRTFKQQISNGIIQ